MSDVVKNGGRLFLLVGNSGSGKDTLIRCVAERWVRECPALYTPRRYITRPSHPSEPFISLERDAFARMRTRRSFFLDWVSYGIHYGLPGDISGYLEGGAFVLANVSREVIDRARERYAGTRVVFVKVPLYDNGCPPGTPRERTSQQHWLQCPPAAGPPESWAPLGRLCFRQ